MGKKNQIKKQKKKGNEDKKTENWTAEKGTRQVIFPAEYHYLS